MDVPAVAYWGDKQPKLTDAEALGFLNAQIRNEAAALVCDRWLPSAFRARLVAAKVPLVQPTGDGVARMPGEGALDVTALSPEQRAVVTAAVVAHVTDSMTTAAAHNSNLLAATRAVPGGWGPEYVAAVIAGADLLRSHVEAFSLVGDALAGTVTVEKSLSHAPDRRGRSGLLYLSLKQVEEFCPPCARTLGGVGHKWVSIPALEKAFGLDERDGVPAEEFLKTLGASRRAGADIASALLKGEANTAGALDALGDDTAREMFFDAVQVALLRKATLAPERSIVSPSGRPAWWHDVEDARQVFEKSRAAPAGVKVGWGTRGAFDRCVRVLVAARSAPPANARTFASYLHRRHVGTWPQGERA